MSPKKKRAVRAPDARTSPAAVPAAVMACEQPMTRDQAARLKSLAGEALEPEAFRPGLTTQEATRRIRALEAKLKAMDGPPHTV